MAGVAPEATVEEEVDVVVVGGGLAGLGTAWRLASSHHARVVVLEATVPKLDGQDRFDRSVGASFKNAGMLDFGVVGGGKGGVREYFAQQTIARYKEAGVRVLENGAYVAAKSTVNAVLTDVVMERMSRPDFEEREPDVRLKTTAAFRFPRGAKAEPEAAMSVLLNELASMRGVKVLFDSGVADIQYDANRWTCTTLKKKQFRAKKLVLAAGPQTKTLLETHLRLTINTKNVLGLLSESAPLAAPWLRGSLLGAKSSVDWTLADFCCCCCRRRRLNVTSMIGESDAWTTHLYLNVHDDKIYVGGPRLLLPDTYSSADLDPARYRRNHHRTVAYAKSLVALPTATPVARTWAGVMVFPADMEGYPLVGPVDNIYDDRLFLNTAHASAGFREAYGAGILLADILVQGLDRTAAAIDNASFHADFRAVLPALGSRVTKMKK